MSKKSPAVTGIADYSTVRVMLYQGSNQTPANAPASALREGLQPSDEKLTGLASMSDAPGVIVQTTADTFVPRTLIGTVGEVQISNGDGVSGNPAFSLPSAIILTGKTIDIITPWVAYTPTLTGFGTPGSVSIWSRRIGDTLMVRGRFTAGTSTAAEARMTLGFNGTNGGITSDSTKVPAIQLAGPAAISSSLAGSVFALVESGVGYLTFGQSSSSTSGMAKRNGNDLLSSGNFLSLVAEIPISGW